MPQALPKFNLHKQAVGPIPNGAFTRHSREKQEPHSTKNVDAERKCAGNEWNGR
jgi:hypothetical protein